MALGHWVQCTDASSGKDHQYIDVAKCTLLWADQVAGSEWRVAAFHPSGMWFHLEPSYLSGTLCRSAIDSLSTLINT